MIDLHAHTTASDGTCTPAELVRLAHARGLRALGVTDHDTVAGLEEATATAAELGLELVPGIEISVDYPHGEFHLLGYFLDFRHPEFLARVNYLQENRFNRNGVMLRRMQEQGFDVTLADVEAEAGGGQIGRPHFARALVKKGYAASVQDAFERYVGEGKPLHVAKVKLGPEEAIRLVHLAGGAAVLAHPKYLAFNTPDRLVEELAHLRSLGLDGLECYYSQHTEEETATYLRIAADLGFVVSAGSDFHGTTKADVPLGVVYRGRGGEDALLEPLRDAARSRGNTSTSVSPMTGP